MYKYNDFIPQNVASPPWRRFVVINESGNKIGQIALGGLAMPKSGDKLYSFGALSDVHIVYDTAADDFKRALSYLNDAEDVAFTCICGDLTDNGTTTQLAQYKAIVDSYSPDTPVYAVAGNHEQWASTSSGHLQNYTGQPLYYTFEHQGDLFVMLGVVSGNEGNLFAEGELDWFEGVLNGNAGKRIFVFQHVLAAETSGDVLNIYPYTKLRTNAESVRFKNILKAHPNAIWFHGHSHMKFYLQEYGGIANYDKVLGCHSIHIPSLAVPRDVNESGSGYETIYADSEGYVVDVYENGIHLRGRDFVRGEFLPIASYWLPTT